MDEKTTQTVEQPFNGLNCIRRRGRSGCRTHCARCVEVTALRAESSTTYVNPDGSVTVESATGPVRVKDSDGSWHDVDTTLVHRDGGIEPRQAAADIRISDGGSDPLAEVNDNLET